MSPEGEVPVDEVLQVEPLSVKLEGATQVHVLPSRVGISRTVSAGDTVPVPLVGRDTRRKALRLLSDKNFYVGSREDVRAGLAAVWLASVPCTIEATEEIYVRAAVTGETATIAVISENWAF